MTIMTFVLFYGLPGRFVYAVGVVADVVAREQHGLETAQLARSAQNAASVSGPWRLIEKKQYIIIYLVCLMCLFIVFTY
jgi:hypothetical protein